MNAIERIRKTLQEEMNALDKELRIDLPKEIGRALEMGDLRENAEYKAALERQEYLRLRIAQVKKRLSDLSMVNFSQIPKDRAAYGSTVHLFELSTEQTRSFRLSMPEEADPAKGWVSTTSPIGKALMGCREGDEVVIRVPSGTSTYEVTQLITLHDEEQG